MLETVIIIVVCAVAIVSITYRFVSIARSPEKGCDHCSTCKLDCSSKKQDE